MVIFPALLRIKAAEQYMRCLQRDGRLIVMLPRKASSHLGRAVLMHGIAASPRPADGQHATPDARRRDETNFGERHFDRRYAWH